VRLQEIVPDAKLVPEDEVTKMLEEETPVTPLDMAPAMPAAHSTQKDDDADEEENRGKINGFLMKNSFKI
jgi:hypothetical protein